jgi:hypothetical protein
MVSAALQEVLQKRHFECDFFAQNGVARAKGSSGGREEAGKRIMMDDGSKCPVSGKRKYATEGEALATAAHQIATTNAPKELRAYLCSWCEAWHLTKNTGTEGKRRK